MRRLAAIKMSLHHYLRLLFDYRDIWIYPNEWTKSCVRLRPNYFVVVLLPSRQIKWVARPTACNYECCVFSGWEIRLHRLQIRKLDKWIKKERLKRFHRFKDQNTHWDSICTGTYQSMHRASVSLMCVWSGAYWLLQSNYVVLLI